MRAPPTRASPVEADRLALALADQRLALANAHPSAALPAQAGGASHVHNQLDNIPGGTT